MGGAAPDAVRPVVLKAAKLPDGTVAELRRLFALRELPADRAEATAFLARHGAGVRGVALRKTIVDAAFLDALPDLEVIASYSAGLDNVDLAAVRARGITITNTSHILVEDVANLATGLAIALTRDLVAADAFVRGGRWPDQPQYRLTRSLARMTVGIVGFGTIGAATARRLEALGARVAYTGPSPKPVAHDYHADVLSLAAASDLLVLTCPLNDATRGLVTAEVLAALGPRGYLVNVARGPVVDEDALVDALARDAIAGAALDVFVREPDVPRALRDDPRVILTPHIGSGTEETRQAMADNVVDELAARLGVPVLSR
jgi:lactate dehydrogenase-like 2-hydroxyacid dehydrogenase